MYFLNWRDRGRQNFHFDYDGLVYNIPDHLLRKTQKSGSSKQFQVFKEPPGQPGLEGPESLREENSLRWAQHFFSPQSIFLFVTRRLRS